MLKPKFPGIRRHRFRSGIFKIAWRAPKPRKNLAKNEVMYGLYDPNRMKIWIYPSSDPEELLDTVLDETMHANFPDLDDDSVREGVIATMNLLRRMGMEIKFNGG